MGFGNANILCHRAPEVVDQYKSLEIEALSQYSRIPAAAKDAYFQSVLFPVQLMSTLHQMYYAIAFFHRLPKVHGHMMFGLTAAHAAGSIAIVMVGIRLKVAEGTYLLNDDMLNGVVMMILFTCIIGSMVTEKASRDMPKCPIGRK